MSYPEQPPQPYPNQYPSPPAAVPYYPPPQFPVAGQPKNGRTRLIVGGVVVGLILFCLCGGLLVTVVNTSDDTPKPAATTEATTRDAADDDTADEPATVAAPDSYKQLDDRQWLQITKDPDAHSGEGYIVHGWIMQFDSITGPDAFLAEVGGKYRQPEYGFVDYPTTTVLNAGDADFAEMVEGDLFTAKVAVVGSFDYDTAIGGSNTVPLLTVMSIKVTGSLDS
jgi:hypothetical protein